MQTSEFNVPCSGKFVITTDEGICDMEVYHPSGVVFHMLDVPVLDTPPPPVIDLNTGVILKISEFVWRGLRQRIDQMITSEPVTLH